MILVVLKTPVTRCQHWIKGDEEDSRSIKKTGPLAENAPQFFNEEIRMAVQMHHEKPNSKLS